MKSNLQIPVQSRQIQVPQIPRIEDLEPSVKSPLIRSPSGFSPTDASEIEVNKNISRACFNAEMNRKMSHEYSSKGDTDLVCCDIPARPRKSSVTFGNESEIGYESNSSPGQTKTITRHSKEFDGNRSGRTSSRN